MTPDNKLQSGWTLDVDMGAVCHFRHYPMEAAKDEVEIRDQCFVVETINWTIADGDETVCHKNEYFVMDLRSAIALAARMEIEFMEVAEDIVGIRPATETEEELFLSVGRHLSEKLPDALSEEQAEAIADEGDAA